VHCKRISAGVADPFSQGLRSFGGVDIINPPLRENEGPQVLHRLKGGVVIREWLGVR
jgi:hypothetical protein